MKPVKVVAKNSLRAKFIVLQILTILLVAITLVSFSDISLPPLTPKAITTRTVITGSSGNENANIELEKSLKESQKLASDKQARIDELESQVKTLQNAKKGDNTESANETVLKNNLQQLQVQITAKDTRIEELENMVRNLQNGTNTNTSTADKATADKLRTQVQQLETRNALLVKLNNDLKKNNEYLSSQLKAAGAGN